MPLPTKKENESDKQFIGRCMNDEKMLTEYTDEGQRYMACCIAVCLNHLGWKIKK